ncbi:MAG TPA: cytochrome c oxidase assembly protein [Methylomirabilota bacterium]|nr:cytochrome c oxidase assembly protein [Methylomirabilota bacterium]
MTALVLSVAGTALLAGALLAYVAGWARLRALGHARPTWRLAAYGLGIVTIFTALVALHAAADARFSMHMAQHLLLIMVGAPLLALGDPLPLVLWGLPRRARRALAATLRPGAALRRALAALTWWPLAGGLYVLTVWAWHVPALYDAAAEHEALHVLEHLTFLATGLLFWWPILEPAPRLRPRPHPGVQIVYLVAATAQNTLLGMILSVPDRAFYPYYVRQAAARGLDAVGDQSFGGGLMWSMGHMYLLPIFWILWEISRQGEREEADSRRPG